MSGVDDDRGALRVLVIDDEPFIGAAIQQILQNCDVTVSTNGDDGITQYEKVRPDLVLCDLMMPGTSGVAVYQALKERDKTAQDRIVFMTGGAFTKATQEFIEATNQQVLKKPVSVETLLELVRERTLREG